MKQRSTRAWDFAAVAFAVVVVKELRRPSAERTWHGQLAGIVPYDLRRPTLERIQRTWWQPDEARLLTPHVWGIGWSINLGRIARLIGIV